MMNTNTSLSQIQYTLITTESSFTDSNFNNKTFHLLRECPIDILQLVNTISFFEFKFRYGLKLGLELFTLPEKIFTDDIESSIKFFHEYSNEFTKALIKVFIIDPKIKSHDILSEVLSKIPYSYFTIIDCSEEILSLYKTEYYFNDGCSLIKLLNSNRLEIEKAITELHSETPMNNWEINIKQTFFKDITLALSNILETNYFILNQIIGKFWIEDYIKIKEELLNESKLLPDQRVDYILNQAETIDGLTKMLLAEKLATRVSSINPLLPTLILISPFHFPRYKKIISKKKISTKDKTILNLYLSEQHLNYCYKIDERILNILDSKEVAKILTSLHMKLMFLDEVGYLHALFALSPVIRLPLIGKSINMDLSHLENITSNRKKAVNKIAEFGENLSKLILNEKIKEYLSNRNGQIFVISDLPIEWLFLDGFPLNYTHDVCRIPEYNQNGIVNNCIHNQRYTYEVSNDLIDKTLVIHCASKNDVQMKNMFQMIDSYKDDFGFKSTHCSTITEIKEAISLYHPELLIFDCHVGFEKDTLSSFLILDSDNNIKLTGDDIIANNITAPLVLLSACSTMPNYGYVNFLSDAFMEIGCFTVTATFIPLSINDAALFIIRILGKLFYCKNKVIHSNWLEFISHALRTTIIHEAIHNETIKHKSLQISNEEISLILSKTMIFTERKNAIKNLNDLLVNYIPNFQFDFKNLNNEWLSYTIIGRADLLYFENWIKKYREINIAL